MCQKIVNHYFRIWTKGKGQYAQQSVAKGTEISVDGGISWESSDLETDQLLSEGWTILWGDLKDNGDEEDLKVWGKSPEDFDT